MFQHSCLACYTAATLALPGFGTFFKHVAASPTFCVCALSPRNVSVILVYTSKVVPSGNTELHDWLTPESVSAEITDRRRLTRRHTSIRFTLTRHWRARARTHTHTHTHTLTLSLTHCRNRQQPNKGRSRTTLSSCRAKLKRAMKRPLCQGRSRPALRSYWPARTRPTRRL